MRVSLKMWLLSIMLSLALASPALAQKFDWQQAKGTQLRVLLNKRSRTNLATDYAWGKDGARGFYLGIQEAF